MRKIIITALVVSIFTPFLFTADVFGQHRTPKNGFHAGIHSGSWTETRALILEEESKDPHRSCSVPYCSRCSKHLADYGHEYQFIDGPSQRQHWYCGTTGSIAPVTQRCYDEHGRPYQVKGHPGAVMSWEYKCYLNHAIQEQINARNAVAAEEAAEDRVALLRELYDIAFIRANQSGECRDIAYLAEVERELIAATQIWGCKTAFADEKVRIALRSKEDADKATRFKRIQHKPPKNYKELLAVQEAKEAADKAIEETDKKEKVGE